MGWLSLRFFLMKIFQRIFQSIVLFAFVAGPNASAQDTVKDTVQSTHAEAAFADRAQPSPSRVRLGFYGAGNFARTLSTSSVEGKSLTVEGAPRLGYGSGLSLSWFPASLFSLELGTSWQRRVETFAGVWTQSDYLELPFLAHLHPLDWFSFGAGIYYGYQFYRATSARSDALISADETGGSSSRNDLGFLVSARLDFRLEPSWGLFTEGRGAMSVVSLDSLPGVQDRWESLQFLVGLAFYP
jgi:hypothetical protein